MELDVVELFAGVGGFRVGLNHIKEFDKKTGLAIENGEWNFVYANQWEPSTKIQPAYECYITRFGNSNNVTNIDIANVDKSKIPNHSLLVGGFPCQDYSVARSKSTEMGIEGKKGVLWWDIVDVLYQKETPFILLENVDRLLKSPAKQRGRDFAVMLKTLDKLDYIVQWRMVNAGEYEMPQKRRRVFIFAAHKDTDYASRILNISDKEEYLVNDGFFNEIFPIEKYNNEIELKDLDIYKDTVDISDNYDLGKFLTSGVFVNGQVLNFNITEKSCNNLFTLGDIINLAIEYQGTDLSEYIILEDELEKWKYLKGSKRVPRTGPNGNKYYYSEGNMSFPDSLNIPSRTMLTSESTVNRSSHAVYDKYLKKIRRITEIEAELLQMFPANWTNTGMTSRQRYFMMGNALVTGIISKLEEKLRNIIITE